MPVPRLNDETAEPQTLDEVREWHRGVVEALVDQRASALRAIQGGSPAAPRFVGMTHDEIHGYFESQRRELDRLTILNLVASAEAAIRVDFFRRVRDKLKDHLSKTYRKWYKTLSKKKQRRPDFDEDGILRRLKDADVLGKAGKRLIGEYRECLRPRHWVAHGRYWAKPVEVDQLDPDHVYDRAVALIQALPK